MKLKLKEKYDVLDEVADIINVGEYKEETNEYLNCTIYNAEGVVIAQYRYFTDYDIPEYAEIKEGD